MIVGASTSVVLAAKRATTTIPIVFTSSSDLWVLVWLQVWRGREAMSRASRV